MKRRRAIQSESYALITGELERFPSVDNETDLGTKYLERDRIERCMTRMVIVGAWASKQLLMVSGTGVIIGEDPIVGHSWKMGVVLLDTLRVGLLSCASAVFDPHLPTGKKHVMREPEVARQPRGMTLRSMQIKIINHPKEKTRSLSRYSGDRLRQLMMSNKRSFCDEFVQFLLYITIISENLNNVYPILVLSLVSVRLQVAMTTCANPKLTVAHELEYRVVRSAGAADGENE